ncbi:MAG: hypothetical protein ACRELD_10050 [Longimicrobiales bacterium]
MGLFRPSRETRGPDPYLDWKIGAFMLGAALGVAGMITNRRALIVAAIVVLFLGFLLRFLPRDDRSAKDADSQ